MIEETLRRIGLTEGEIKVYFALVELGSSSTGNITKKSGISGSKVYEVLDRLIQKGLAGFIVKNNVKYFQATQPGKIAQYVNEKKDELEKDIEEINKMLPELIAKANSSPKTQATIYLGIKGIRTAHEGTYRLKKGEEYCYLGIPAYQPDEQHIYWKKDHAKRAKMGIKIRALFNRDTVSNILKNRNSFWGCDARYMPEGIKTPACFITYKDTTVILLQSPQQIAVEITNQEINDSFQAYFEEFWKLSKK